LGKSFILPDISQKFNILQGYLLSGSHSRPRDWKALSYTIQSLNTLLTTRFTIPISTELYDERVKILQTRSCKGCTSKEFRISTDEEGNESKEYYEIQSKIPVNEIVCFEQEVSDVVQMLIHKDSRKVWECPKCSTVNLCSKSPSTNIQHGINSTFGVIYEQPVRTLLNRSAFDRLCMNWLTDFQREVDEGMIMYQKTFFEESGHNMKEDVSPFGHDK